MQSSMIDVKNLQKVIGKKQIISCVNAELKKGDVVALLGKNGAGKTTLIETLLGFSFPSAGVTHLYGVESTKIDEKIKQKISFVPQENELLFSLTAKSHINLFKAHKTHWSDVLVERLIKEWEVPMDMAVGKLSLGQQQKLTIILALANEPELLVLDEPVASLDPLARRQFLQQLVEVASNENRATLFSTHIVTDVERVANKVWILHEGKLAYQGGLDELKESIARLHITAKAPLPSTLGLAHTLSERVEGERAVVTVSHFSDAILSQVEKDFNALVHVEHLSLEDIFLEMIK